MENSLFPNPNVVFVCDVISVCASVFGWKSLVFSLSHYIYLSLTVWMLVCMANIGLICLCGKLQGVAGGGANT